MKLVTAAIIRKDGKVLLTRRAPGEKLAGFWEFPGGKVDANETLAECLVRELREELGIVVVPGETFCESDYSYDHGAFRIIAIEAKAESYDFQLKVHDQVAWVQLDRLREFDLLPADRVIIEALIGESNEKV